VFSCVFQISMALPSPDKAWVCPLDCCKKMSSTIGMCRWRYLPPVHPDRILGNHTVVTPNETIHTNPANLTDFVGSDHDDHLFNSSGSNQSLGDDDCPSLEYSDKVCTMQPLRPSQLWNTTLAIIPSSISPKPSLHRGNIKLFHM
jgi:hypothetical protein